MSINFYKEEQVISYMYLQVVRIRLILWRRLIIKCKKLRRWKKLIMLLYLILIRIIKLKKLLRKRERGLWKIFSSVSKKKMRWCANDRQFLIFLDFSRGQSWERSLIKKKKRKNEHLLLPLFSFMIKKMVIFQKMKG